MQINLAGVIASTLTNHDFEVVTNVPGFGGTQVYDEVKKKKTRVASMCLNEEAAFSISTGASIYGARSALLVKTHGLTKMANALCSTLSVGANAANLVFAFDDTVGKSSDNIFDALGFIKGTEVPYVVMGEDPEHDIIKAIQISEQMQLSVVIYVDCETLNKLCPFIGTTSHYQGEKFSKRPLRFVACPPLSRMQRETFLIKKRNGYGGSNPDVPRILGSIPQGLPPNLRQIFETYSPVFDAFGKIHRDFVAGDAGTATLYAFHERQYVDACTYMGGAPGMALGAHLAGAGKSWAISGDFSFLAAGILGVNEIISRDSPIKILVFNNGVAGATGGQVVPRDVMNNFIRGHSHIVRHLDVRMPAEKLIQILGEMNESTIPQIGIIAVG